MLTYYIILYMLIYIRNLQVWAGVNGLAGGTPPTLFWE